MVVELKATSFKPEHAGKLSFYTSAIDGKLKQMMKIQQLEFLYVKSKMILLLSML